MWVKPATAQTWPAKPAKAWDSMAEIWAAKMTAADSMYLSAPLTIASAAMALLKTKNNAMETI